MESYDKLAFKINLYYGDIIYDKHNNESFKSKIECSIALSGAIQVTSRERLYEELGLQSLANRRWYQKLIFFDKIVNRATPRYLNNYLSTKENLVYNTRASDRNKIRRSRARTEHFKQSLFPFC